MSVNLPKLAMFPQVKGHATGQKMSLTL